MVVYTAASQLVTVCTSIVKVRGWVCKYIPVVPGKSMEVRYLFFKPKIEIICIILPLYALLMKHTSLCIIIQKYLTRILLSRGLSWKVERLSIDSPQKFVSVYPNFWKKN